MANFLTDVILRATDGVPADNVVNTFAWTASSLSALQAVTTAAIPSFYNGTHSPGTAPISDFISSAVSRASNAIEVRYYDITTHLDGSPHGSPVASEFFTLSGGEAATALPSEVSLVLSYHSAYGSAVEESGGTRPRARLRGRCYIGPLTFATIASDTGRPTTAFMNTLLGAGESFMALGSAPWSVWSRMNAAMTTVSNLFVDNAFDTQRRRGPKASTRVSFP